MKIEYLGHSCFRLTSAKGTVVLTDVYTGVGYELPKGATADIVTVSHGHFDHNATHLISKTTIVNGVEEQRIKDVTISGILTSHDDKNGALRGKNIVFKIQMDDITICHLGDLGEAVSSSLCKEIGKVDVLCVPVGGTYTIDAQMAKAYVDELAPAIVIPMHYKPKDGTLDITDETPFLQLFEGVVRAGKQAVDITEDTLKAGQKKIIFMERNA